MTIKSYGSLLMAGAVASGITLSSCQSKTPRTATGSPPKVAVGRQLPMPPPEDPDDVFSRYIAALNDHDVALALSFLAETFTFRVEGADFRLDKSQVRDLLEWDAAVEGSYRYSAVRTAPNELQVVLHERNRFFEALGVEQRRFQVTYRFGGGQITEQILSFDAAEEQAFEDAFRPARAWVQGRPADWARVTRDGSLLFNGETARIWLRLLQEYGKRP